MLVPCQFLSPKPHLHQLISLEILRTIKGTCICVPACFYGRSLRWLLSASEVHLTCSPCQSSGLTSSSGFLYHSCAPSDQLCLLPPAGAAFPFLQVSSFSCFPRSHSYLPFYSGLLGPWPPLCENPATVGVSLHSLLPDAVHWNPAFTSNVAS